MLIDFLSGILLYSLLCLIGLSAGYGLISLLQLLTDQAEMLLIGPASITTWWVLLLNIFVHLDVPLKYLVWPIWISTLIFAVIGIWRLVRLLKLREAPGSSIVTTIGFSSLFICWAMPLILLWPHFIYGLTDYLGSTNMDTWHYTAQGQYLWQYGRGASGILPPFYQLARLLTTERLTTGAMLGFFSTLVIPGEVDRVRNLFVAWTLFTFATGCGFFACATKKDKWIILVLPVVVLFIGWGAVPALVGNWDNELALYFSPVLAGLAYYIRPTWRWGVVIAALISGVVYTYIELAPIILIVTFPFFVAGLWRRQPSLRTWIGFSTLVVIAVIIELIPGYQLFLFFLSQFKAAQVLERGGGFANGLLEPNYFLSAFWALGEEHRPYALIGSPVINMILALFLTILLIVGFITSLRQHHLALSSSLILILIGVLFYIVIQQYGYGAYKILSVGWWIICLGLILGIRVFLKQEHSFGKSKYLWLNLVIIIGVLSCMITTMANRRLHFPHQAKLSNFREIRDLETEVSSGEVLFKSDNPLASLWAIYYLRDSALLQAHNLLLNQSQIYPAYIQFFRSIKPTVAQAQEAIEYLLIDRITANNLITRYPQLVWAEDPSLLISPDLIKWTGHTYQLWQLSLDHKWVIVIDVETPSSVELNSLTSLRIGPDDTVIHLVAGKGGTVILSGYLSHNSCSTGNYPKKLSVITDHGFNEILTVNKSEINLAIPLVVGQTKVRLSLDGISAEAISTVDGVCPDLLEIEDLKVVTMN